MEIVLEAIYEDGVFKPLKKVPLREGEEVRIIIRRTSRGIYENLKRYVKKAKEDLLKMLLEGRR